MLLEMVKELGQFDKNGHRLFLCVNCEIHKTRPRGSVRAHPGKSGQGMTRTQYPFKSGIDRGEDVGRKGAVLLQGPMDGEVRQEVGAGGYDRDPNRTNHRNGYRTWPWDTRGGSITFQAPRFRTGSCFPRFLEPQ